MQSSTSIAELSFDFALRIVSLCRTLTENREYVISQQLLTCGTSIGANVEEANAAQSKRDFISKMAIASKEAGEARYWLRLLNRSCIDNIDYSNYLKEIESIIR